MASVSFVHDWTKDGLRLQGVHWKEVRRKTCVLFIHGTSGNIIENYFAHVLGEHLVKHGYGFFYGHTRGYNHLNDILTKDGNHRRIGARYETFSECMYDIDLWVRKVRELGYDSIIVMGHSLGANKAIHYLAHEDVSAIAGLILASPPDLVGLSKRYDGNRDDMIYEAQLNVKNHEPMKILSHLHDGWLEMSSQAYLERCLDECEADNLPVLRNPDNFGALATISRPIFAFMGDVNEVNIHTPSEDLALMQAKATRCPTFEYAVVEEANHNYEGNEHEVAQLVVDWINQKFAIN
ncbi:alpha/beta hydrolase [Metabacillus iocasae]|uniref:Alpha-beta hydrolase superfamily lysophospholipase n=1 Tax=Priestia iocasae TaxID=2291674 RepID=A0ABS2R0B0_9BACI|nr:alpha/beta hydrolase [Metabacillus iocasae]MBM7704164.1 alpha-beta hydrolase superfamily lysophospholipase [Metabacillus iocasae]